MTNIDIYKKRITALILMSATPLIAAGPFLIALLGATVTQCYAYDCPWSVLPWFSFLTAPVALVAFILGLVWFFTALGTRLNKTEVATPQERKLKSYYFAWMATALGPLIFSVLLLLAIVGGPVAVCDINSVCTETAQGAFVRVALIVAPVVMALSCLYLLGLWVWNKRK
jgi:hypothetical protein